MFNKGGQRRTLEAPCGWRCVGHPQEVNGKYRIHKRLCETCKDCKSEVPDFDKANGNANGWKGIANRNHRGTGDIAKNFITTCVIDGKRVDIRQDGNSMEDATTKIRENEEFLAALGLAMGEKTDKKKKKRKNKKRIYLESEDKEATLIIADGYTEDDIAELLADLEEHK